MHEVIIFFGIISISSFRMAVEEQKHGILALIGTAVSMISVVSIPWAIRKIRRHFQQNQIGVSIAMLVYFAYTT